MTGTMIVGGLLCAVLSVWVLTGGADFGGGVWDLLATGSRRAREREVIAKAIGPIWEANHVWLILALVLLFTVFPRAYALVGTALHVPIVVLLVGIVSRGAAFVFRAYDSRRDAVQAGWSLVFAAGSIVSPVMLGVVVGAIASGRVRTEDGVPVGGWFAPWLQPFPVVVGLLTLAIVSFLAAVYLTLETRDDRELQEDFRRKGLAAAAAVFGLAWTAFFLARTDAPLLWSGLWASSWAVPFQLVVGTVGASTIGSLAARRYRLARDLAAAQVVLVVGGWAASQWPYVVPPDITVADAAPPSVVRAVLLTLAVGAGPLVAAYGALLWVFKGRDAAP